MSKIDAFMCNMCGQQMAEYKMYRVHVLSEGNTGKHVCYECAPVFQNALAILGIASKVVSKPHEGTPGQINVEGI